MKKNWIIVNYNKEFVGDEVVVRFFNKESYKNTKILPWFDKSFPRKDFFKKLKKFNMPK